MTPNLTRLAPRRPALLLAVAILSGCAAGEGPRVSSNVGSGAAIGTVLGAVAGAIIARDDRAGALVGAGVGLLAGAAVGDYLDRQQAELEQNLEGTGATVTNTGEELLINLPSEVTFDFDSAAIRPEFTRPLNDVAETLNDYPESLVDVIGHTDSVGTDAYNLDLSEQRADTVAGFLTRRGVMRRRVAAYGEGESAPIADNATEAGRARNRRVELRITPLTES